MDRRAFLGLLCGAAVLSAGCKGQTGVSAGLRPGTATATPGDGEVTLSATGASGGVPPYRYQWYASTDGTRGTAIAGATGLSFKDAGLTNGVTRYYTLEVTDSA